VVPDEFGLVKFTVDDLEPETDHRYRLVVDETPDEGRGFGQFSTPAEGPYSFTVTAASCARTGSNVAVYDTIRAVDPLFHKTSAQFDEGGARGACRGRAGKYASLGGMWHAGWGCRCCKRGQTEHHAVCAPVVTVEHHLHCCASQQASVRESTRGRSPPPMPQACCSTTCRCSMAATLFSTPWMSQRRRWMRAAMWTLAPWWAASCVL